MIIVLFVSGLAADPAHRDYDFAKRRIFPLYQAIDRQGDLRWLLEQVVGFVLRGDRGQRTSSGPA